MSSLHTLPVPCPIPVGAHEHSWLIESRHATSEGTILYVHCVGCGIRRVDLQAHPHSPPAALSRAAGRP